MKLIDKTKNVGHYEVFDDCILIGRDTRVENGIISNGNQILKKTSEGINSIREKPYFYFTTFKEGILYYENEGDSLHYSENGEDIKVTPEKHYFNPIHNLKNRKEIVITEMDEEFNQKYYFLNSIHYDQKKECQVYPELNNEKHYCRFHKKESWIELVDKYTKESCRRIEINIHQTHMDDRTKPFLDGSSLFIPLNNGGIAKYNCILNEVEWINLESDEKHVSYNSNSAFLFQHFGLGINQISKSTGKTIRQMNFSKSLSEKYHSSGSVWCSDDYVITKDLISGKFCVVDSQNMEIIALEFVMKHGISESIKTIQINKNQIFVLGMDNCLREYEIKR